MLVGRSAETERLDGLIERVRAGHGEALALEGEPGAGKTVLLQHAAERAGAMAVLTARGVPSESQISFSGLLELLRPVLEHLPELPAPQASALAGALALGPPTGGDRFAVYAATLSLLARVAQDRAVLAVVDDVHWLDTASAEALRFAARRLGDESVGVLFALRPGEFETSGLPVLEVGALDRDAALTLLGPRVVASVAEELLRAAAGNPLALVEIPSLLTPGQLDGREPLDDPLRAGARAERAFLARVAGLPAAARTALLVAAASGSSAVDAIVSALTALDLDAGALEAAESAGLVTVDGRTLDFRHPLVRSCVYHAATPSERRAAHRALASALEGGSDSHAAVRRAWHRAAAALGPDEAVAEELDAAARDARERTGYAAAAIAFERAAELTPVGDGRARRTLHAAEAWQLAGRSGRAVELLDAALAAVADPLLRARMHHLKGRVDIFGGPAIAAKDRLVAEAARIAPTAPELAAHMLFDAAAGCIGAGRISEAVSLGRRAHEEAARLGGTVELLAALHLGKALVLHAEREGDAQVMRCVELLAGDDPLRLAMELAYCAPALMTIEEYDLARAILDRLIEAARAGGAFGLLVYCLGALAELDARTGRWAIAYAGGFESVRLAREADQMNMLSYNLARLAWVEAAQGRDEACRAHADEALEQLERQVALTERPMGLGALHRARGLLAPDDSFADSFEAALGWYQTARTPFDRARTQLGFGERLRRSRRRAEARGQLRAAVDTFDRLGARPWAERARGELRASGETTRKRSPTTAEQLTAQELQVARVVAEGASNGEAAAALFVSPKTIDSHLRSAYRKLGVRSRTALARAILGGEAPASAAATLAPWPPAASDPLAELTPQERHVAQIVAGGATNREAAGTLFLTEKTVEFRLTNAYRKLGVRSRADLVRLVEQRSGPGSRPGFP